MGLAWPKLKLKPTINRSSNDWRRFRRNWFRSSSQKFNYEWGPINAKKDLGDLFAKSSETRLMVERVEMSRRNVVVDGKVYSVKRESEPVFRLRLSDLSDTSRGCSADALDCHGFRRLVRRFN